MGLLPATPAVAELVHSRSARGLYILIDAAGASPPCLPGIFVAVHPTPSRGKPPYSPNCCIEVYHVKAPPSYAEGEG